MLIFFQSPGACSVGTHIILEEAGADYDTRQILLAKGEQNRPDFRAQNPKGKVPALLREDGTVLTEYPVIALWLARHYPHVGLVPDTPDGDLRALELIDYMVATMHMRGFTFVIMPTKFSGDTGLQQQLIEHGRGIIDTGFAHLAEELGEMEWLLGTFSIADATLFYLTRWAHMLKLDLPDTIRAHHRRMLGRPAVQRVMAAQGLDSVEKGGALA